MDQTESLRSLAAARALRRGLLPFLLATLAGVVAAAFLARVVDQAVSQRTEASLTTALERLQPELDALIAAGEDPAPRILAAGRLLAVRATLIAPDGRVVADSDVEPARLAGVESHADRPEVKAALTNGTGSARRLSATVSEPFLYLARRISGGYVVRFAASTEALARAEAPFRRKGNAVAVAAGVLVGALLVLTRRRHAQELELLRSAIVDAARGTPPGIPPATTDETAAVLTEVRHFADLVRATGEGHRRQIALARAVFGAVPAGLLVVDRELRVVEGNSRASVLLGFGPEPPAPGTHVLELLRDIRFEQLLAAAVAAPAGTRSESALPTRGLLLTAVSLGGDAAPGAAAVLTVLSPATVGPPADA